MHGSIIIYGIIILWQLRSGYNATTMTKLMSGIYIMALRVGPKHQRCNVGNRGIAHITLQKFEQLTDLLISNYRHYTEIFINSIEYMSVKWSIQKIINELQ